MKVREFCLAKTQTNELCVIRDSGYIIATVWIDSEDIFQIAKYVVDKEVESDYFGNLTVRTEHGDRVQIPCHYINI